MTCKICPFNGGVCSRADCNENHCTGEFHEQGLLSEYRARLAVKTLEAGTEMHYANQDPSGMGELRREVPEIPGEASQ